MVGSAAGEVSETPPPDNKKATKVDTGPAVTPAPAAKDDWKQKETDSRRRNLDKQQTDEAARQKAVQDEQTQKGRCRLAQSDLNVLEQQVPLYKVNEKGERVYMEDKARPAAIARARKEVQTYCK